MPLEPVAKNKHFCLDFWYSTRICGLLNAKYELRFRVSHAVFRKDTEVDEILKRYTFFSVSIHPYFDQCFFFLFFRSLFYIVCFLRLYCASPNEHRAIKLDMFLNIGSPLWHVNIRPSWWLWYSLHFLTSNII